MSSARSFTCRPGASVVKAGGVSRPVKTRARCVDLPTSIATYEPDSSVCRPDTVLPEMRGRTTQKRVSSTRRLSVPFTSSAVAITPERSGARVILLMLPTSMSLYLILVLPACRPSAVRKLMMMVVPRSSQSETASHAPTAMATSGTSQMRGSERRELRAETAGGKSGGGVLLTRVPGRIPQQPRIEAAGRRHGEDDHRAESERARPRPHGGERRELHYRGEERDDEDVEHRPAADGLERAVQARPLRHAALPAELHRDEQQHEAEHLRERHHDARHENDHCQIPGAVLPEEDDAAHDGVGLRGEERARRHDRQRIGGHVERNRRDDERPRASDSEGLAKVQGRAAARAL